MGKPAIVSKEQGETETMMRIRRSIHTRLVSQARYGERLDAVIERLLDAADKEAVA